MFKAYHALAAFAVVLGACRQPLEGGLGEEEGNDGGTPEFAEYACANLGVSWKEKTCDDPSLEPSECAPEDASFSDLDINPSAFVTCQQLALLDVPQGGDPDEYSAEGRALLLNQCLGLCEAESPDGLPLQFQDDCDQDEDEDGEFDLLGEPQFLQYVDSCDGAGNDLPPDVGTGLFPDTISCDLNSDCCDQFLEPICKAAPSLAAAANT